MNRKFTRFISFLLTAALLIPTAWLAPAAEAAVPVTVYQETFAGGQGLAKQSGGALLTPVTGQVFDGNADGAALYVSSRSNNWDAVDFAFSDIGLQDGKTYTVTVTGYVADTEDVPAGAQAFLQMVNSYAFLAGTDYVAGQAFTLTKAFTVDTSTDSALRVQSSNEGATVPFYIGEILITAEPETSTVTVYHETFSGGQGLAKQSGGALLTPVTDQVFDGNEDGAALYVSSRSNDYDAVDFDFDDIGLEDGKTYTVTVTGYVYSGEDVPAGAQAFLQTVNSYAFLAGADYVAGQAFTLTKAFTVDASKDTALRVQSNATGKAVPFYIGDVLITEETDPGNGGETPRPPALPFDAITFEDQTAGGFTGRAGTEALTITDEANHTEGGSYALKVEGRASSWHGPSLRVEQYVDKGHEYIVTAWVKLIEPASSQLQLSTQIGDGGSANYVALSPQTISTSDGWVKFEGSYRYNNVGGEYLTIYVESSNNATASFYIDDISFVKTGSGPIEIETDLTPIKDAYQSDFLIGNAISAEDVEGVRLDLLKMHHNVATAGNAMKPDAMQRTKGDFTFAAADALVDKVLAAGMQMHGHVLVWHQQSPDWMNTTTDENDNKVLLDRAEALTNLQTHIRTVMEHYGDKVISWDVVNEAMSDNPPNPNDWEASLRRSAWYNAIGPDYVEQAFLAARAVLEDHPEWDIKLYYNDYNEDNQNKAQAIYGMVKAINDNYAISHPGKLLIDGVGMQGHYTVNTNPSNVRLSLEKFISLGVEISITELDIQAGSNYELSEKLANDQAYLYAQLFKLFKEHTAHIKRVTFWGMDDNTSWRAANNPLLFDKNLQAKPAYYGVIDPDAFLAGYEPEVSEVNQGIAKFGTPVIDGMIDEAWSVAPEMPINRYQMAWQGATGTARALWDNDNLYVLIQVSDSQLDKSNANAWEQDSIEIFLDENNAKTTFYEADDGQYRVNYDNETSFSTGADITGFESATQVSGTNYTVEVKLPLKTIMPSNNLKLGFDVQINDAKDGARQSVAAWNDTTGNGFQDPSVFGELTLNDGPAAPVGLTAAAAGSNAITLNWRYEAEETVTFSLFRAASQAGPYTKVAENLTGTQYQDQQLSSSTTYYYQLFAVADSKYSEPVTAHATTNASTSGDSGTGSAPSSSTDANVVQGEDGTITIEPVVRNEDGRTVATITNSILNDALNQATPAEDGKKTIIIAVPEQADGASIDVQLPAQSLQSGDDYMLLLQTATATIELPSNMLANLAETADQIAIRISGGDVDGLSAANRAAIGGRPMIGLDIIADDEVIAWNNPNAPVTITIPYTPTASELNNPDQIVIWYIDGQGSVTPVPNGRYDAASGAMIFRTTHFSTYAIAYVIPTFIDLSSVPWAHKAIAAMAARGVIHGTSANQFAPGASIKRAEFAALLIRALELQGTGGNPNMFSDVPATSDYFNELGIARELGIAAGFGNNTFRPDSAITRQDMMVLAARARAAAGKAVGSSGNLSAYADAASLSAYARDSVAALVEAGIISGKNGKIAPFDPFTRAEAAVILYSIWSR